jgi:hypothetical protein
VSLEERMTDFLHDDDESDRDFDYDEGSERDKGRERDDSPFASGKEARFMPMTRRDVDNLYDHALRDTRRFLGRDKEKKEKTTGQQALSIGEIIAGAIVGGYLSQRFRNAGGPIPTGLLLGGVGFGAAELTKVFGSYTDHVKNVAIGSALASAVIWAAGYGTVAAEKAEQKAEGNVPATGGYPYPPPQFVPSPPHAFWLTPQQQLVSQQHQPSIADFQDLVAPRRAA